MLNTVKRAGLVLSGVLFLAACAGKPAPAPAPVPAPVTGVSLDAAARGAAARMDARLPSKTKIALVSVGSSSAQLSEYIISQLEAALVDSGKLVVVDRANLDKIRQEQGFQYSGDVSDESAKAIGKLLGAGAIVTGSFSDLGEVYHLTLKAINMETAAVAVSYPADVAKSARISAMLASGGGAGTGVYGGADYGGSGGRPTTAAVPAAVPVQAGSAKPDAAPAPVPAPVQAVPVQATVPAPVPAPAPAETGYRIGDTGPAGGAVFHPVVRTSSVPQAVSQVYKVGDTGPAGGIIFYVNPSAGDGWKYLEAAPARTETSSKWAAEQIPAKDINNSRAVGTGKPNSEYIMRQAMQRGGGFGWAAQACDELEVNGFDDWFLPSRDELNMMWGALHRKGIGGFKSAGYWSSTATRDDGAAAIVQNFSDGGVNTSDSRHNWNDYSQTHQVRAIRQF